MLICDVLRMFNEGSLPFSAFIAPSRHFSLVRGACSGTRNKKPRKVIPAAFLPRIPISLPFDLAED